MTEADTRASIPAKPSESCLWEAQSIGYRAGRDDDDFQYTIDGRSSSDASEFRVRLVARLRQQPIFREKYLPKIQFLVDCTARAMALLLARVSDEHASKLYTNDRDENIKHVTDEQFQTFVDDVVPEELQASAFLRPLEHRFWVGWLAGSRAMERWKKRRG